MDKDVKEHIKNLGSSDDKVRMSALQTILKLTDHNVDWVYDIWDDLFEKLKDDNSFQRSIAIMVICNLAKSDTEHRLSNSMDLLLAHTKDDKFITSRQCIQNIWKLAFTSRQARDRVLDHLEKRFRECENEKHYNLIRTDILQSIMLISDPKKDEALLARVRALVMEEKEAKYRKKYEALIGL